MKNNCLNRFSRTYFAFFFLSKLKSDLKSVFGRFSYFALQGRMVSEFIYVRYIFAICYVTDCVKFRHDSCEFFNIVTMFLSHVDKIFLLTVLFNDTKFFIYIRCCSYNKWQKILIKSACTSELKCCFLKIEINKIFQSCGFCRNALYNRIGGIKNNITPFPVGIDVVYVCYLFTVMSVFVYGCFFLITRYFFKKAPSFWSSSRVHFYRFAHS